MYSELAKERGLQALPYLVQAAKRHELITYKQLAAKIGRQHRALSYPLGYIRDEVCRARGLPMLTAIVIDQGMARPGDSWLPKDTDHLSDRQNQAKFEAECARVFAWNEWDRLPKEIGSSQAQ
jgi:hypothetical protein